MSYEIPDDDRSLHTIAMEAVEVRDKRIAELEQENARLREELLVVLRATEGLGGGFLGWSYWMGDKQVWPGDRIAELERG